MSKDSPIKRYSNLKKPDTFDFSLDKIKREEVYVEEANLHIFPTDNDSCAKNLVHHVALDLIPLTHYFRNALSMKKSDPIMVLFSSLQLKNIFTISKQFAENPTSFISTPLDEKDNPSLEQQLFEERLLTITTYYHPFLSFLFSRTSGDFVLYLNIPLPHHLPSSTSVPSPRSSSSSTTPMEDLPTFVYINNCREQLNMLSRFYPQAIRPIIITNTFAERVVADFRTLDILSLTCSNIRCSNTQANCPKLNFSRCTQCRLVCYCSKECQKMDWGRHKRFCEMHVCVEVNNKYPSPLPKPQPLKDQIPAGNEKEKDQPSHFSPSSSTPTFSSPSSSTPTSSSSSTSSPSSSFSSSSSSDATFSISSSSSATSTSSLSPVGVASSPSASSLSAIVALQQKMKDAEKAPIVKIEI